MLNNKQFLLTGFIVALMQFLSSSNSVAQGPCGTNVILDYFSTSRSGTDFFDQNITNLTKDGSASQNSPASGFTIVGGQRDISWTFTNSSGAWSGTSVSIDQGFLSVSTRTTALAKAITLTYDGTENSNMSSLDTMGLSPSLSINSNMDFATRVTMDQGNAHLDIIYRLFSGPNEISEGIASINSVTNNYTTTVLTPLNSFTKFSTALYPADLTRITAVQVIFKTENVGLDYTVINGLYFYCNGTYLLPVNYGYFKGQAVNGNSQLNWETYDEKNNKGFEVQRKDKDGRFTSIGFVDAKSTGTSSGVKNNYTFIDRATLSGTSYYRLKQIDNNGIADYSQTIAVKNEGQTGMNFQVFPNPLTSGNATILLAGNKGPVSLSLTDLSGNIVRKWEKVSNTQLAMGNLNKGVYILRATDEAGAKTSIQKLTVH